MSHFNIEFPRDIAQGCQAVIERRDELILLASGHEETNQRWTHSRRMWNAGLALRSADDLARVISIFEEVRGRANSFHFRDWQDWRSSLPSAPITPTDQVLGFGDGVEAEFQIFKRYGTVNPYDRPISLPQAASLRVALNGVEVVSGWSLSAIGGLITFDTAPPPGSSVTAGFFFDVPVRFDTMTFSSNWSYFTEDGGVSEAPDIALKEVRLDGAI